MDIWFNAEVAQLAEQAFCKRQAMGSSPIFSLFFNKWGSGEMAGAADLFQNSHFERLRGNS